MYHRQNDESAWLEALRDELHFEYDDAWQGVIDYVRSLVTAWRAKSDWNDITAEVEHLVSSCMTTIYTSFPTFKGDSKLTTWIHSVVMRHLRKQLRDALRKKRNPHRKESIDDAQLHQSAAKSDQEPEQIADLRELLREIEGVLDNQTNPHIRNVFLLIAIRDLPAIEVAKHLGISQPHVSNLMRQARTLLQQSPRLQPWLRDYFLPDEGDQ